MSTPIPMTTPLRTTQKRKKTADRPIGGRSVTKPALAADEPTASAPVTVVVSLRAELGRLRRHLRRADASTAAESLDALDMLVTRVDATISDIIGLAHEAEQSLAPAALAFAVVDHHASEIYQGADERSTFNDAIGQTIADIHAILFEAGEIAQDAPASTAENASIDAAAEE